MHHFRRKAAAALLPLCSILLCSCGSHAVQQQASVTAAPVTASAPVTSTTLGTDPLTGDTTPVRDPSIALQGGTYYLFSTDPAASSHPGYLPIRCSQDKVSWAACGYVFNRMPSWIAAVVPSATILWAPDISYFGGVYHLYYAASILTTQTSAIGEVTNVTLNPASPDYQWVDHGEVIASQPGDDFNAIDPNIFVDTDNQVWLTYGSSWSGIKQRSVDPSTGMLSTSDSTIYSLASHPGYPDFVVEGASLVQHDGYYYLFLSTGDCCDTNPLDDNYEQIVGRGSTPHGPFVDTNGIDLMDNGGTVLLAGNSTWNAPGGGSVYLDTDSGDSLIVFHAANISLGGAAYLWLKQITWPNDWPVLD